MLIGSAALLIACILVVFSIIGLFNKRIGKGVRVMFFYVRRLRANRKNMRKLRRTARKAYRVLRRSRSRQSFLKKVFANYHNHKDLQKIKKETSTPSY